MKNKVVLIAGPTAGGKSALALALAKAAGGTVINADSMQVYAELRVITARPTPADEATVPHRLYGYRTGRVACSAADWAIDARAAIRDAIAAGRLPIVVGGTGLYLRTLVEGIARVPPIDPDVRDVVRDMLNAQGPAAGHKVLAREDPEMAARLNPGDRQRIARALEVVRATGRSLRDWQRDAHGTGLDGQGDFDLIRTVLLPPRDDIYANADRRLVAMIEDRDALQEIAALDALGLDPSLPVMKSLGVPEFRRYLKGETDRQTALDQAQTATRRFAKRQYTWFRNQFSDWETGDAQYLESFLIEKFRNIKN